MARFYDPQHGRVLVDGHDLRELSSKALRSQLGIVPQEGFLFSGHGAREHRLRLARTRARRRFAPRRRRWGPTPFIERLRDGYETEIGERGVHLSAGQRQLIAFARALLAEPRILILDEATSNVDVRTERTIERGLERLLLGRTAIVIAHRLSTIRRAGRIVVLEHGRIVEAGTHEELIEAGGRVRAPLRRLGRAGRRRRAGRLAAYADADAAGSRLSRRPPVPPCPRSRRRCHRPCRRRVPPPVRRPRCRPSAGARARRGRSAWWDRGGRRRGGRRERA